ncbi:MAG: M23 family metallopeptidase [Candidatus Riflebacteria bacterium]|nr:M23 family metallopeptidase [Candidatus Riflebacteria bacterium]
MKFVCYLLLVFSVCTASAAEPVVWPLKIDISQSSSFAEFRGMRLHAGIDLRTKHQNGFPVVAIADGFISRAGVQFRGYGYALYIDHPSLNARVVYGHLQDFQGPLKQYIDAKLQKMGSRHGINDFFGADRFPVKKGQVVALSGEAGSGPSHLHFELRNFADEPLAPALFGYRPSDKIIPEFHYFYVEPLSYACVIDGSFLPRRYHLTKKSGPAYSLVEVPRVSGKIGLQAGISDTNGAGNRYGVEKVSLRVNGSQLLERIFHRYSYDQSRQATWVYDYFKSNEKGTGYVYTLFKWPFDSLYFAAGYPAWSGVLDLGATGPARTEFVVDAEDYGGNQISATGAISNQSIEFSGEIGAEDLAGFNFNQTEQTDYTMVAIGTRGKAPKPVVERAGLVVCRDSSGATASMKALLSATRIEIAFPKEKRWQNGAWFGESRILPEAILISPDGAALAMEAGARAVFARNSLHFPMFCSLTKTNQKPASGGNQKRGHLKPFSAIWTFTPDDKVFDEEVTVSISPEKYTGNLQKLGIYNVAGAGRYSHNGEKLEESVLTFTTRAGGSFVILEDLVAPVMSYSRKTSDYHLGPIYAFKVSDLGEGVDYLSASATVAGKKAEVYSDPDKSEIYVVRPAGGNHKVTLQVRDYAGNTGSISKTIK